MFSSRKERNTIKKRRKTARRDLEEEKTWGVGVPALSRPEQAEGWVGESNGPAVHTDFEKTNLFKRRK